MNLHPRSPLFHAGVMLLGLLAFIAAAGGLACGGGGEDPGPVAAGSCAPAPASGLVARVKEPPYLAKGDGISDDTAALQRAVDAIAGTGGTVRVPAGIYLVNAVASGGRGLLLKSAMTLALEPGAVLRALPNGAANYAVVAIVDAEGVVVTGGTLEGERSGHTGEGGEWGHGLSLIRARRVVIEGLTSRECWGDGFYVSASLDVTLCRVVAERNRRQGLSITSVDGMVVRDSIFRSTGGTLPEAGLDIEPNAGDTVSNVLITGCTFADNAGCGLADGVPIAHTGLAWVTGVTIRDSTFTGNGAATLSASPQGGMVASNCSGHLITGNTVTGNHGIGILLREHADGFTLRGNAVKDNRGDGIEVYRCDGGSILDNTVTGNAGHGIYCPDSTGLVLGGNTVFGNGATP